MKHELPSRISPLATTYILKMRQHPLRKERLEEQPMETETPQPPKEEDVDNEMMKKILGQMYTDKDYLEKLLNENGKDDC